MKHKTGRFLKMFRAGQRGSAMILVLIFMAVAGMVVPPLLTYMTTGLKAGIVFEQKTQALYAAESGVNDGLWFVRWLNDGVANLFGEAYTKYGFYEYSPQYEWSYTVNETMNDLAVDVTFQNVWIPQDIPAPSESQARGIIEAAKLLVLGSAGIGSEYKIEADFYPGEGDDLQVETLGVWLPPGFAYVEGSSTLETDFDTSTYITSVEANIPWASGKAVIWHFASIPFGEFGPDVEDGDIPIKSSITFQYTADNPGMLPVAVAWMTTSGATGVPFTWDANVKVYRIESTASDVSVQVYATRSETRQLGAAVKGDYVAIGNVLETDTGDDEERDRLLKETSATVTSGQGVGKVPATATIRDAWLYWSGWVNDGHPEDVWTDDADEFATVQTVWSDDCASFTTTQTLFQDACDNYNNWTRGGSTDWDINNYRFRAHHSSGRDRNLTLTSGINLQPYLGKTVTIAWDQSTSGTLGSADGLDYQVSGNGGGAWSGTMTAFRNDVTSTYTYTIPDIYKGTGFKIRFLLVDTAGSGEYIYVDNIRIQETHNRWDAGAAWAATGGQFRGHYPGSGGDPARTLTKSSGVDLSPYIGQTVTISWYLSEDGTLGSGDALRYSFSDIDSSWSPWTDAFRDDISAGTRTVTIPVEYVGSGFRVRFYLEGFAGANAYIDNITVTATNPRWIAGAAWTATGGQFRGHYTGSGGDAARTLTLYSPIDLSLYEGMKATVSWNQSEDGSNLSSSDGLRFSVGNDSGWGTWQNAFHNDNPTNPLSPYTIPALYVNTGFKIRFFLDDMAGSGENAYIDNIVIIVNDMGVDRVVFNGIEVTADEQQFKENTNQGNPTGTYSYSCAYDATDLVKQMIEDGDLQPNGAGTYTVGHVLEPREGDEDFSFPLYASRTGPLVGYTGYPLGIPSSTPGLSQLGRYYTYAAWSLILIYASPDIEGHQIYLYDDFDFVENASLNLPVSGFLAPSDPSGSHATFFVGEGDAAYTGDGVRFNGQALSDGISGYNSNNVWNSHSNALPNPYINGIDLDTFDISAYIQADDTSADVELWSTMEIYNVVYVLLSFRSESEFGGVITYLIGD
jgi:hypothetical protein